MVVMGMTEHICKFAELPKMQASMPMYNEMYIRSGYELSVIYFNASK